MVALSETYIENREMVLPDHANVIGTVSGGPLMAWMDEVASLSATRFAGETCLTVGVSRMTFERPIPVGRTAFLTAYVYAAGETSVRVRVRADNEELQTGEREPTTEAYFTFVAIDDDRDPTPVPELTTPSDRDRRLREEALAGENGG